MCVCVRARAVCACALCGWVCICALPVCQCACRRGWVGGCTCAHPCVWVVLVWMSGWIIELWAFVCVSSVRVPVYSVLEC